MEAIATRLEAIASRLDDWRPSLLGWRPLPLSSSGLMCRGAVVAKLDWRPGQMCVGAVSMVGSRQSTVHFFD